MALNKDRSQRKEDWRSSAREPQGYSEAWMRWEEAI